MLEVLEHRELAPCTPDHGCNHNSAHHDRRKHHATSTKSKIIVIIIHKSNCCIVYKDNIVQAFLTRTINYLLFEKKNNSKYDLNKFCLHHFNKIFLRIATIFV